MTESHTDQYLARLEKLKAFEDLNINPYPNIFKPSHYALDLQESYKDLANEERTENEVIIAGRIKSIRNSGMFIDLHDNSGKIQVYSHENNLSPQELQKLKLLDLGDMIGVKGTIRRTKRGELTVDSKELFILAKSLLPLPEKFHGLTDVETRYRQRYLDMITNDDSKNTLRKRFELIGHIRHLMEDNGFLEVETPMLHPILGGANARPFMTHHNSLDMDLYLRIAPELYLKRLIIGGFERVFEIGRNFRNEGISIRHNPEFTMMELYQSYADYNDMMELAETLIKSTIAKSNGELLLEIDDNKIDFSKPFDKIRMLEAVAKVTGIDFLQIETAEEARTKAQELNIPVKESASWGDVVLAIFEEKIEPTLINPTFVLDYPIETSPLTKTHRDNNRLCERFELFINGWEIANAYSELTNPLTQQERFLDQVKQREAGDNEAQMMDEDFVTALNYGLVPTGGMGIGIDRLMMLATSSLSIRDVIAFPTLRNR